MSDYIGRFAPSPTGPLHFGSLIAALGSFLDAKANEGNWLVRIEDLDPPRSVEGATEAILNTLEHYHLYWDQEVVYQSQRFEYYEAALDALLQENLCYPCDCTRKILQQRCPPSDYGIIYDRHCLQHPANPDQPNAVRLISKGNILLDDEIQGAFTQNLENEVGDFHIKRRDGLFAYHLGVVVDDYLQGITHIVRGFDLLDSTPRQIYLQQTLKYPTPHYAHLPLAIKEDGQKLSKQNLAPAISKDDAAKNLVLALDFLHQCPPVDLHTYPIDEILLWGVTHWDINQIPKTSGMVFPHNNAT